MLDGLRQIGCEVEESGSTVRITGLGGRKPVSPCSLFMGNAGTAMRPLTAALALLGGEFELSGRPAHARNAPLATWWMPCGNWAATSITWAIPATLRCASRTATGSCPGTEPAHPGAWGCVEPVLTALLMALPLVATQTAVH